MTVRPDAPPLEHIGSFFAQEFARALPSDLRDRNPGRDRRAWIEENLTIAPKETSEIRSAYGTIPLRLNKVQRTTWETWRPHHFRGIRQSILKFRQGGISTLVLAYFFEEAWHVPNTRVAIVSDDDPDATAKLLVVRQFIRGLGSKAPTRKYENLRRIQFDNGSVFEIETGRNKDIGRGGTLHKVLLSEAARYDHLTEILAGITQAVPADGDIVIETTANGMGSFHQQHYQSIVDGQRPGWETLFLPWFAHDEYRIALDPGETITPTAEEQAAVKRFALTPEQLKWRRVKRGEIGDLFAQEHPETAEEAFLLSGRARFDREALMRITKTHVREPIAVEDQGALRIFEVMSGETTYTMGVDTAEGTSAGDYDSAHLVNDRTAAEVAVLHGKWPPHIFADKIAALGRRYGTAMLAVERNNHGHAVLQRLVEGGQGIAGYPLVRIYRHVLTEQTPKFGWLTDVVSKPIMETGLDELVAASPQAFRDAATVLEMSGYVYLDDGKTGAVPGGNDDRVVSRAIAEQARRLRPMLEQQGVVTYEDRVMISPV